MSWSPTTTPWPAPASRPCSAYSPTSRSPEPPPTASRRSRRPGASARTSSSWTSACPAWTASRPPAALRAADAPAVLILTTFDLDRYVYEALRAGAGGFLLKDAPPGQLAEAVRTVTASQSLLAPAVTRRLIERFRIVPPGGGEALHRLTDREREVLTHVGRGRSNAEIAHLLRLSEATVKTHLSRVLAKTALRDRVAAVVFTYEQGFIHPGAPDT